MGLLETVSKTCWCIPLSRWKCCATSQTSVPGIALHVPDAGCSRAVTRTQPAGARRFDPSVIDAHARAPLYGCAWFGFEPDAHTSTLWAQVRVRVRSGLGLRSVWFRGDISVKSRVRVHDAGICIPSISRPVVAAEPLYGFPHPSCSHPVSFISHGTPITCRISMSVWVCARVRQQLVHQQGAGCVREDHSPGQTGEDWDSESGERTSPPTLKPNTDLLKAWSEILMMIILRWWWWWFQLCEADSTVCLHALLQPTLWTGFPLVAQTL